ncbi:MAG: hypothetical protein WC444_06820 [Candidatus Paceibacterota bacterium]
MKWVIACFALALLCAVAYASITQSGDDMVIDGNLEVIGNVQIDGNFTRYNPHATFYDLTTQTLGSASTAYYSNFSNFSGYQLSLENGKNITIDVAGHYTFAVSAIFTTDTVNKCAELWFRINNTDVPNSNTKMCLSSATLEVPLAVALTLDLGTDDWVNVMIATDDAGTTMPYTAATGYSPAVPSIILEVWKTSSLD